MNEQGFTGTFEECLKHFLESSSLEERVFLGKFCGARMPCVQRWVRVMRLGKRIPLPGGIVSIKIRYFLEHVGYNISEMKDLLPGVYAFSKLLGFGVLTAEEAQELLVYKKKSQVFCSAFARHSPGCERLTQMDQEFEKRKDVLAEKIAGFPSSMVRWNSKGSVSVQPQGGPKGQGLARVSLSDAAHSTAEQPAPPAGLVSATAAYLVRALLPLTEEMITWTPAQRVAFRRQFGSRHELHELSDLVNALLSEEVLQRYLATTNKLKGKQ